LDLQGHALAGGAGSGPPLGAAQETARERARRALAGASHLRRRAASGARALVPLSDEQMAVEQDELAGRKARAAARRGYGGGLAGGHAAPARPGRAAPGREPAPL